MSKHTGCVSFLQTSAATTRTTTLRLKYMLTDLETHSLEQVKDDGHLYIYLCFKGLKSFKLFLGNFDVLLRYLISKNAPHLA